MPWFQRAEDQKNTDKETSIRVVFKPTHNRTEFCHWQYTSGYIHSTLCNTLLAVPHKNQYHLWHHGISVIVIKSHPKITATSFLLSHFLINAIFLSLTSLSDSMLYFYAYFWFLDRTVKNLIHPPWHFACTTKTVMNYIHGDQHHHI